MLASESSNGGAAGFSKLEGDGSLPFRVDGPALYDNCEGCAARGYKPNITCQYDRAEAVLLSVGAGLGISIIPEALRVFYAENVSFTRIPG